ncbi:ribosomal protein l15 protein, partial [Cystoisospora suis]
MLAISERCLARIYVIERDSSISFDEKMERLAPIRKEMQSLQRPYHKMFICLLRERDKRAGLPSLEYTVDNPLMANAQRGRPDQSSAPAPFIPPPRPFKKAWETKLTRSMPLVPFYKSPPPTTPSRSQAAERASSSGVHTPEESEQQQPLQEGKHQQEETQEEADENEKKKEVRESEQDKSDEEHLLVLSGEKKTLREVEDSSPSWKKSQRLFECPTVEDETYLPPSPPPSPPVYEELVWNLSSPKCWAGAFYFSNLGEGRRSGFEGGQMPLYRKLPKFVGRPLGPAHQEKYRKYPFQLIRLPQLNVMHHGEECDWLTLKRRGASLGSFKRNCPVKIVGPSLKESTRAKEGSKLKVKGLVVKAHAFTRVAARAIRALGGRCLLLQRPTQDRVVAEYNPDYKPKSSSSLLSLRESSSSSSEEEDLAKQRPSKWASPSTEEEEGEFGEESIEEEKKRYLERIRSQNKDDDRPIQVLVKLRRRILTLQLRALRRLLSDHRGRLQRSLRVSKKRTRRVDNLAGRIERIEAELEHLQEEKEKRQGKEDEDEEDEKLVVLKKIPRRYVYPGLMPRKQRDLL